MSACDHDELDRYSCPVCGPAAGVEPDPTPVVQVRIPARHAGLCPRCDRTILPGDDIGLVDGQWWCPPCTDQLENA